MKDQLHLESEENQQKKELIINRRVKASAY